MKVYYLKGLKEIIRTLDGEPIGPSETPLIAGAMMAGALFQMPTNWDEAAKVHSLARRMFDCKDDVLKIDSSEKGILEKALKQMAQSTSGGVLAQLKQIYDKIEGKEEE